jgi:uncharacterized RDD family membrane protein YckC
MPIPALQQQEVNSASRPGGLQLVETRADHQANQRWIMPRVLAHGVDACVLSGFSVYVAKIFSVVLISFHGRAIAASGKVAASVFQQAFDYSSSQLFAACFASFSMLYFVGLPLMFGRTPGQAVFGLRIVGAEGAAPTLRQLVLRLGGLACAYGSAGILCLSGLRGREGRFVHDSLSGTIVVKE